MTCFQLQQLGRWSLMVVGKGIERGRHDQFEGVFLAFAWRN
jgi:hypothetical protein